MHQFQFVFLILFLLSCQTGGRQQTDANPATAISDYSRPIKFNMPEKGFYCGYLDSKGTLWFGSRGNGVFSYDGSSFVNFTSEDGLCDNDISCIAEDNAGNLWFGNTNGLCSFDGKTFSHLNIPQSDTSSIWLDKVYPVVNPNQVMSILHDSKGYLWIGTNGAGVYRYDGRTFTQFLSDVGMIYEDGKQHNIVLSIIEDPSGNIWFTSLSHGGVSRYDGKNFTHFVDELSDDFVRVVFSDKKGNIWIGTHGNNNGGLDLYDGEKFKYYFKTHDGLSHNNVRWIYEDKNGKLWLGSGTSLLSIFDGEKFEPFISNDSETFNKILFIVGDRNGDIWFGGKDGLWRFDGETVRDLERLGTD